MLVLPAAFFVVALGGSDEWSETEAWAVLIGFPLVAWGALVVVLVLCWRGDWRRLWSLPLVVFFGLLIWPLLFLLSSGVRRAVLPYKPKPPIAQPPRPRAGGPGVLRARRDDFG
jgi:hypothetical protein